MAYDKQKCWAAWDESDIVDYEVKFRLELQEEDAEEDRISEERLRELAYQDTDLFDEQWGGLCDNLTEWMKTQNNPDYWVATVKNFGWLNRDGHAFIRARSGKELLQGVLPRTDCTFYIWKGLFGKSLVLQNYHHDSPTGNEWYTIRCANRKELEDGDFS